MNEQKQIVPFPDGFRIHDTLYNEDVQRVGNVYVILWNAGYIISVKGVPCARIFNQRQVVIEELSTGVLDLLLTFA